MEEWTRWEPVDGLSGKFYVTALILEEDNLIVRLTNNENGIKVEIIFDGCIDAYRYTNDSFSFKIPSELRKKYGVDFYGNWSFFKITNSQYLSWLSEKSCEYSKEFSFTHFCIVGGDEIVDILARYEPTVKIKAD